MATTPTSIGPIGARQINRNLYVGHSDLTSVQKAVTVAGATGGFFTVIIPFDYTGGDVVTAVTGGSTSIEIIDQRGYQMQTYTWSGTQYAPQFFQQANGFISQGKPSSLPPGSVALYYDPTGTAGVGTAHIDFTANSGMGMPSLNFIGHPSDGTAAKTFARFQISPTGGVPIAGIPQMELPAQLGLFNEDFNNYNLWTGEGYVAGGKGMTVWAKAAENAIDFQGQTIGGAYDQTIRLNYLGGAVRLGPTILVTANGAISGASSINAATIGSSGLILANQIEAQTCEVGNSPVRTFANTPDGPGQGMVWPTEGIAVSLGDHWQDPSIDPASLATWPAVGIPVSTGTAWGASIPSATIPRLNTPNTFTTFPQIFSDGATVEMSWRGNVPVSNIDITKVGLTTSWNLTQSVGETAFTNVGSLAGSGGFHWYNTWIGGPALNPANFIMSLDSGGNLVIPGTITSDGYMYVMNAATSGNTYGHFNDSPNLAANSIAYNATTGIAGMGTSGQAFSMGFYNTGTPANNYGILQMALGIPVKITMNGGVAATSLSLTPSGKPSASIQTQAGAHTGALFGAVSTTPTIMAGYQFDGFSSDFSLTTTWLNMYHVAGQTPVIAFIGNTSVNGNITASGTISSGGAKSFHIIHPLDEEKDLVHACIEGPECAVFYRGESATTGGWAEITLPDYFEALTMEDHRSVLLTTLFEDEAEQVGMLAASRVKDGKFKVWSGLPEQKFYWEVMAVRADIEPLEVEIKGDPRHVLRANRDRTPQDGKPDPENDASATADATATGRTRHAHKQD